MRTCLDSYDEAWCKEQSGSITSVQASRIAEGYYEAVADMGRLDVLKWLWVREPTGASYVLSGFLLDTWPDSSWAEGSDSDGVLRRSRARISRVQVNALASNPFRKLLREVLLRGGHLELLKHLREKGCEWDESTCAYAASEGHVHVLEYLRTNGCPWEQSRVCTVCCRRRSPGYAEVVT